MANKSNERGSTGLVMVKVTEFKMKERQTCMWWDFLISGINIIFLTSDLKHTHKHTHTHTHTGREGRERGRGIGGGREGGRAEGGRTSKYSSEILTRQVISLFAYVRFM